MLKNIVLFRADTAALDKLLPDLETQLAAMALKPIGPQELSTAGFVPFVPGTTAYTFVADGLVFVNLGIEKRVLPPKAVEREVAKRLAAVEERLGKRLGAKARKELSHEVHLELLPRALAVVDRVQAFIDPRTGYFGVGTGSRKTAEHFASVLRAALGSFPVERLAPEVSPLLTLTAWLRDNALPEGYEFGGELLLKDEGQGATIRAAKEEIASPEVVAHLQSGKSVRRLAVHKVGRLSVVLADDLVLRKLSLVIKPEDAESDGDTNAAASALDATAFLFVSELRALLADLAVLFGPRLVTPQPQLQRPLQLTLDVPEAA